MVDALYPFTTDTSYNSDVTVLNSKGAHLAIRMVLQNDEMLVSWRSLQPSVHPTLNLHVMDAGDPKNNLRD